MMKVQDLKIGDIVNMDPNDINGDIVLITGKLIRYNGMNKYLMEVEGTDMLIDGETTVNLIESNYTPKSEQERFNEIMNTKEYLTQEEYDFCFDVDKSIRIDTSYVGNNGETRLGVYLNLRLYSEHDEEIYDGDDCNNMY